MTLIEAAKLTEDEAGQYLETILCPDGTICPSVAASSTSATWKVRHTVPAPIYYDGRNQFTVMVRTVMHRTKIGLDKWLQAFQLMCSSK